MKIFSNGIRVVLTCACLISIAQAQKPGEIVLKQASTHPMRYYISLPPAWKAGKSWPVVVAIEDADRDFLHHAEVFAAARSSLPFIVVVPEVITNGGPRYREAAGYSYTESDWSRVASDGPWEFDEAGIDAVMADVHRLYGGQSKYYLTAWEAGAHTGFALAFNHPENVNAFAAVCPNYQGRNVSFSSNPGNSYVPIRIFAGSDDPAWAPGQPLYEQANRAIAEGRAHGFIFAREIVKGRAHEPLADVVMKWFGSILPEH